MRRRLVPAGSTGTVVAANKLSKVKALVVGVPAELVESCALADGEVTDVGLPTKS